VLQPQVVIGDDGRDVDWGELPEMLARMSAPPDGLPIYRVLTGPDDAAFCRRVSDAIGLGYRLYGGPAVTFNGEQVIVAQALIWPDASEAPGGSRRTAPHHQATPVKTSSSAVAPSS